MASVNFDTYVNEIVAITPKVPPPLVDTVVRHAAIEFCRTAGVWIEDLAPISSVVDQDEYTLTSANSDGHVRHVISVIYDDVNLGRQEWNSFKIDHPDHPNTNSTSTPFKFTMKTRDTLVLFPIPDTAVANGIEVRCTIIPKQTATGFDSEVAEDYEEYIIHGALFRLLTMPGKDWSNPQAGEYHGRRFRSGIVSARSRIEKGFIKRAIGVKARKIISTTSAFRRGAI
jgi:hypothetical protein